MRHKKKRIIRLLRWKWVHVNHDSWVVALSPPPSHHIPFENPHGQNLGVEVANWVGTEKKRFLRAAFSFFVVVKIISFSTSLFLSLSPPWFPQLHSRVILSRPISTGYGKLILWNAILRHGHLPHPIMDTVQVSPCYSSFFCPASPIGISLSLSFPHHTVSCRKRPTRRTQHTFIDSCV